MGAGSMRGTRARTIAPQRRRHEAAAMVVLGLLADAALGQAVVSSPLLPARIREGLEVESGLNDAGPCRS